VLLECALPAWQIVIDLLHGQRQGRQRERGPYQHAIVSDIAIFVLKRDVKLQLTN